MIKAIVAGAAGRMGKRIIHMIQQHPEITLGGAFEMPGHPGIGEDAGQVAGTGPLDVAIAGSLESAIDLGDVLIDFTSPQATLENVRMASARSLAMVIGTTGISGEMLVEVEDLAEKTRCVMAPNMSVGVNVMFKIAGEMARILGNEYDTEILEVHHRQKKDAPSGTAMMIAEAMNAELNNSKTFVYGRHGKETKRQPQEISIHAIRGGTIVGEHSVIFAGPDEMIEIRHTATSRKVFGNGAIKAAQFLVAKEPGLYTMDDVLK